MDKPIKITRLETENIKRVRAVALAPAVNGLTIIGGDNNQGKTSVLDAISWALGGDRFRPSQAAREGSAVPPHLKVTLSNGIVVERKGKNSSLTVVDPSGNRAGQQLLNAFVEQLALDLPRFLQMSDREKADTLLQIIGVGEQLAVLEQEERELYNQRHAIGQIADQKEKYAKEQTFWPDAPKDLISASDLIARQQDILARNGENQRKRAMADMLAQQELELNKARRYEKAGTISKLERMTVEVNRDAAKRDLLSSQTDCAVAERELAGILREEHVGALSNPLFVLTSDLGSLQDWIDKAMAFSPLLQTIDAKLRQADQGVAAAKAAWHPQVYAFATGNLIKHYLAITEPDWIAGIGVRFTLWDNKDRNENIAAARSLATKAQAARSEAVSRLETAVQTAYLRSEQAREQHRLTDSTLALAQENLRLREKSFAEGLSTADEVNDARTKLLGAQIARRVAAYRFVAAWAALNGIAGTMHEFESSANRSDNIFER